MKEQLPPRVVRTLAHLGESMRIARLRRRISQKDLAELMGVSVGTVQRVENGDPGVGVGVLAMAFLCLGDLENLSRAMDPSADVVGAAADMHRLPQRVRSRRVPDTVSAQNPSTSTALKPMGY